MQQSPTSKGPHRVEHDSMGEVSVPKSVYWGAQTQRCLNHFHIRHDPMPSEVILAYAAIKKACAMVNCRLGKIDASLSDAIIQACDEIQAGQWHDQFPLTIWQTGSGTATNMNLNEVIANRANEILGKPLGHYKPVHPNDHVNCSQSSNDTFPTAMHMATFSLCDAELTLSLDHFQSILASKVKAFDRVIKIGRTHCQDAVPLTLGQEFSGYLSQISAVAADIKQAQSKLLHLAIGSTAVGTGLNAPDRFDEMVCAELSTMYGFSFVPVENTFHALSAHTEFVALSGCLKNLACSLQKISNDIRLMGSGPRCGLAELSLPSNEPGSSIMPGKVNPTQCEAMHMLTLQVMTNDQTIAMAAASGQFELNVTRPLLIHTMIQSIELLSHGMRCFADHLLQDLKANEQHIADHLNHSLMLVTCLNHEIGYENAAKIAHYAYEHNLSLREACAKLDVLDLKRFDELVDPSKMV